MIEFMNRNLSTLAPSGIRRFTALAKATPDCAMLTIGEPDFDTPEPIKAACKRALDEGKTHYPPNAGDPALRAAIADFERVNNGMDYAPDEILMTHGATEALFCAMQSVLNPGDEVIIPTPAFGLYETIARLAGASCVRLDTSADGFQITREALKGALTDKTRLLILNSPNNPTGTVYSAETLQTIHDLITGRPMFVLCDDVYNRLAYAPCPSFAAFRDLRDRLLVVQSFSKPYAMTGWRMGYLMADAPVMERIRLYHAAVVVSVSSISQDACLAALSCDISGMLSAYRTRRDLICGRLERMKLPFVRPDGAFYVFPRIDQFGLSSEEFCLRMISEGRVAGVPGDCFGAPGFVRFSYCCSLDTIEKGMDRLESFIKTLSPAQN